MPAKAIGIFSFYICFMAHKLLTLAAHVYISFSTELSTQAAVSALTFVFNAPDTFKRICRAGDKKTTKETTKIVRLKTKDIQLDVVYM